MYLGILAILFIVLVTVIYVVKSPPEDLPLAVLVVISSILSLTVVITVTFFS